MSISSSDIIFVYSGGSINTDPDLSLGGEPSAHPVIGILDNLFNDIASNQASNGYTDFRCFYIFNDSMTDALMSSQILVSYQVPNESFITIGFLAQNDQQVITLNGNLVAGTMTIMYETDQGVVTYDPDPNKFASNVQDVINSLGMLSSVSCSGQAIDGVVSITVTFANADGNRYQPELVILDNSIGGATSIVVTKIQNGSPVNAIASTIADATAAPPGVGFINYGTNNPFLIGNIYPGDGFPVWVKRTTSAGTGGIRGDGFRLQLKGQPKNF